MTPAERLEDVAALLRGYRLRQHTERQLQDGIAAVLREAGIAFERERALSAGDRPDFLVAPGVCVEVKIQGSPAEVRRQIERYAAHDDVAAILLVTTRRAHDVLPADIGGKPVHTLCVGIAFL